MKVSAKTEYACVAMIELAARYADGEPVRIRSIAEEHGIPARFLVQILLQLKAAGLVQSTRGAAGGYVLSRPPDEVTLGEVMRVIDRPEETPAGNPSDNSTAARVLRDCWREVAEAEQQMLDDVTLTDLLARAAAQGEPMYYI